MFFSCDGIAVKIPMPKYDHSILRMFCYINCPSNVLNDILSFQMISCAPLHLFLKVTTKREQLGITEMLF